MNSGSLPETLLRGYDERALRDLFARFPNYDPSRGVEGKSRTKSHSVGLGVLVAVGTPGFTLLQSPYQLSKGTPSGRNPPPWPGVVPSSPLVPSRGQGGGGGKAGGASGKNPWNSGTGPSFSAREKNGRRRWGGTGRSSGVVILEAFLEGLGGAKGEKGVRRTCVTRRFFPVPLPTRSDARPQEG